MKALELDMEQMLRMSAFREKSASEEVMTSLRSVETQKQIVDKVHSNVVLIRRINDIPDINNCFRSINEILHEGEQFKGYFRDCSRKRTIQRSRFKVLDSAYTNVDFVIHRVVPKVRFLEVIYDMFSKGRNKRISKAEVLGRLIYCGFEIVSTKVCKGETVFIAKKAGEPLKEQNVSKRWIYAMPRIGKNGKIIRVYKIRTMHPYSEFLQGYLREKNGYDSTGKIKDDFRITKWGGFLRKYWLDELPQLINVLKGELKLVGLRPVGKTYFEELPTELKEQRILQKPGCIPPYVAFNFKSSVKCVQDAELEYLRYCAQNRFADCSLFFKSIYNIMIRGKRSA